MAIKEVNFLSDEQGKKEHLEEELLNLSQLKLKHPNVVFCHGYYFNAAKKKNRNFYMCTYYMVFDFSEYGDLSKFIESGKKLSEIETELFLEQILNGLHFLKKYFKMFHRDLKDKNIIVKDEGQYAIIDFSESKYTEATLADPYSYNVKGNI